MSSNCDAVDANVIAVVDGIAADDLPLIFNGKFFTLVQNKSHKEDSTNKNNTMKASKVVVAKCMLCPKHPLISGSETSTGNFHKHLKRKHPEAATQYDTLKLRKISCQKVSLKCSNSTDRHAGPSKVHVTPFQKCKRYSKLPANVINELICNYIVEEMLPISTVEKQSFRSLISGLSGNTNSPCRQTLKALIDKQKEEYIESFKYKLRTIRYVCTTADIWSTNNKSYMGVTCHYLDEQLKRHSTVLACRRMKYSHTHLQIAKTLSDIHAMYNIKQEQIVGTVTDNAKNFGKSFQVYAVPENNNPDELDFLNDENISLDVHDIPDFSNITENLNQAEDDDITLPHHYRCASHTLNLIATKDSEKALQDTAYKRMYHVTFAKLTALWNFTHRSTLASDEVEAICNMKLIVPCPTRWNSFYDSINRVLLLRDHLSAICEKLQKPKLRSTEIEFLIEYVTVMGPIAKSLDFLQSEDICYLGYVIPTLFQIKNTLNSLSHLIYCTPLKNAILDGIHTRYKDILDMNNSKSKPYILATVSHPKFKLRWLNSSDDEYNLVKTLFLCECEKLYQREVGTNEEKNSSTSSDNEDFFHNFIKNSNANNSIEKQNVVQMECLRYFEDKSKTVDSLLNYNLIQKVFRQYNTILPSSAPVERLFSAGGQILTPRRNRLSDSMFETLLMLKKCEK